MMKKQLILLLFLFFSSEAFSSEAIYIYSGITSFDNKYKMVHYDGSCYTHKETKPRFEIGANYHFKRLKTGAYLSYTKVNLHGLKIHGMTTVGIQTQYSIAKVIAKENLSDKFDIYGIGKIEFFPSISGIYTSKWNGFQYQSSVKEAGIATSFGIGVTFYPIKRIGVFVNFDYMWNQSKRKVLNQGFLHSGISIKL